MSQTSRRNGPAGSTMAHTTKSASTMATPARIVRLPSPNKGVTGRFGKRSATASMGVHNPCGEAGFLSHRSVVGPGAAVKTVDYGVLVPGRPRDGGTGVSQRLAGPQS